MCSDRNVTRIIPGEQSRRAERWHAPDVTPGYQYARAAGEAADGGATEEVPTAARIEEIQRAAHDEAYAQGRAEGLSAGHEQVQVQVERLTGLIDGLAAPYRLLDDQVEEELIALAVAVVHHLVRRELKTQPDEIVRVVREAIQVLPGSARDIRVFLNPGDAALIRESLPAVTTQQAWRIIEDSGLSAGGCRVESEHSRVDSSVENRLHQAVAAALGGQRQADAPPPALANE